MKNIRRFYSNIAALFRTLYAGHGARLAALSVIGIGAGIIEGVGISLMVPLFGSLIGEGAVGENFATRYLDGALAFIGIDLSFQILLVATAFLFIAKALLLAFYGMKKTRIVSAYKVAMRKRLLSGLVNASLPFLRRQKLGHIDYVILTDVEASARMLDTAISAILHVTTLGTYVAVSLALSPVIAFLTLGVGMSALFILRPIGAKLRSYSKTLVTTSKEISRSTSEAILGIKSIKAFGAERSVYDLMSRLFLKNERAEVRKTDLKTFIKVSVEPITVLFVLAIFAVSYKLLIFDLAAFVPIMYLAQQIFQRVEKIQTSINLLNGVMPHARSLENIVIGFSENAEPSAGTNDPQFTESIAYRRVSFDHGEGDVIRGVEISIRRGETVGIIGPSGSGKTTLADLVLRFIDPTDGSILLDGADLKNINPRSWRAMTAYVAQDVFLKNGTVEENIRFYDGSITDAEIVEAARRANIHDFVSSLPDGYKTIVGERGARLSGGERQRVALARALVRKPALLVMDEATSALDNEAESTIKETLRALKGSMTIIVIAHRLSTVIDADRVYVVDCGSVCESGSPRELLQDEESYFSRMSRLGNISPERDN